MAPIFMILGIAFVAIGASGQRTFLWSGISFLILGSLGFALSRKASTPAAAGNEEKDESAENNS